jgi:outer membrane biosynthesis protein TonB
VKHLLYLTALSLGVMLVFAPAALAQDVDCPELSFEEAQAILAADPSDPNRLDADKDGTACDNNAPSPQPAPSPAPQPKEKEKSESKTESSKDSPKGSSTKETTATKEEEKKQLPATGGTSLLLPAGALLLGTGLIVSVVLRRR